MTPSFPIKLSRLDWQRIDHYCSHPAEIDTNSPSDEEITALQTLDFRKLADPKRQPAYGDFAYPVSPPPLHHFNDARHHARYRQLYDAQHLTIRSLLARYFAGHPDPPSVLHIRHLLLAPTISPLDQPILYQLFASITPAELRTLQFHEALTLYELARAIHHSQTRRRDLCRILQQFLPSS